MIEQILHIINKELPALEPEDVTEMLNQPAIKIKPEQILTLCQLLHTHPNLYFDLLECITGIDNGPGHSMEVIYNLYSIVKERKLAIQVVLPRPEEGELPEVPSVSAVWRTADWLERETYDLLGIHFTNHPDLRRILLPADWQGHPLRKDYKVQDYYHGIKTEE